MQNLPQYRGIVKDKVTARLIKTGSKTELTTAMHWAATHKKIRNRAKKIGRDYVKNNGDITAFEYNDGWSVPVKNLASLNVIPWEGIPETPISPPKNSCCLTMPTNRNATPMVTIARKSSLTLRLVRPIIAPMIPANRKPAPSVR